MSSNSRKHHKHSFKKTKRRNLRKERQMRVESQIDTFVDLIQKTNDIDLKNIYVKRIRGLSQKIQYPLPESVKILFCRRCSEVFTTNPVRTFSIRVRSGKKPHIVYTCLKCGYIRRKYYS